MPLIQPSPSSCSIPRPVNSSQARLKSVACRPASAVQIITGAVSMSRRNLDSLSCLKSLSALSLEVQRQHAGQQGRFEDPDRGGRNNLGAVPLPCRWRLELHHTARRQQCLADVPAFQFRVVERRRTEPLRGWGQAACPLAAQDAFCDVCRILAELIQIQQRTADDAVPELRVEHAKDRRVGNGVELGQRTLLDLREAVRVGAQMREENRRVRRQRAAAFEHLCKRQVVEPQDASRVWRRA